MSLQGLGRVKTKSDLVVVPSGRQIFAFFYSPRDRRAQNSGAVLPRRVLHTAKFIRDRDSELCRPVHFPFVPKSSRQVLMRN